MFLSNLTMHEVGQKHLFSINNQIIIDTIYGMMMYFDQNKIFDFGANILENVAGLSEGRQFMIENKYIEVIVVAMCKKDLNLHRRRHLIRCLRNLLFEYEKYEGKFV